MTYRIPEVNLAALEAGIAKLNKRAQKLGVTPVTFTLEGWEAVTLTHASTGIAYVRRSALVEVVGETPRYEGWRFAAKIEPTEAGNLVKLMPGVDTIPARFSTSDMTCDHCQKARQRSEVFVVWHEFSARFAQVGRSCLADFLGGQSPEHLAAMAEFLADVRSLGDEMDGGGWSGGIDPGEPTEAYVATVAAFARFEGYVSKKHVLEGRGQQSTGSRAWWWLRPSSSEGNTNERAYLEGNGFAVEARDVALSQAAIAWAKALPERYDNNFLTNLKISASLEWADHKTVGILSALVGVYLREQEKIEINRVKAAVTVPSQHVGVEGQRGLFPGLTITGVRTFDGDYGVRTLLSFLDSSGNKLTWWTGYAPDWAEQGAVVSVKGTVKKFDTYREEAQTVLTRVALVEG